MSESSETHALPAPGAPAVAPASSGEGGNLAKGPVVAMIGGLVLVVGGLILIPPEATLGDNVRMVFFHGAVTWNGILMAVGAAFVGLFVLLTGGLAGRASGGAAVAAEWSRSGRGVPAFVRTSVLWRLLSLAALFWVLSLSLSFPVMIRTWGGVLWNEPKLMMSAELVSLFLVAWAVTYFVGRPGTTAAISVAATGVMVGLLATTPGAFHPDNPIMSSRNPRFIATFVAILAGLVIASLGVAFVRRIRAGGEA